MIHCCCTAVFTLHATKCTTTAYAGVTVSVATGGGTVVGSGTTNGSGNALIDLPPGTYTVTLTDPNGIVLTFSLTMTSSPQTVTKNFITTLAATVRDSCTSSGLSGLTVTFTKAGTTVGTATTNSSGVATCTTVTGDVTGATVTASVTYKGTAQSCTFSPNSACSTTCTISYQDRFAVNVKGCNSLNLPGATVSISPGAATGTTDASGNVVLIPTVGVISTATVTITASKTRFVTGTATAVSCAGAVTLLPDTSGYICIPACADPLSVTLTMTDAFGATTLNYDPVQTVWVGCALRNVTGPVYHRGGAGPCTAGAATQAGVQFEWTGAGMGLAWPECSNNLGIGVLHDEACGTNVGTPFTSYNNIALTPPTLVSGPNGTCPPGFSFDVTYRFASSSAISKVYGTSNTMFTITE